tara:strand:+ start:1015 stop:1749 length:735 start_codon:yes stop_codon:yes gene_type:complete
MQKNDVFAQKKGQFAYYDEKKTVNRAFISGEKLKYKISYGKENRKLNRILAGHAQLNVTEFKNNKNEKLYELNASGKTTNFFSLIFKVKHTYRALIDFNSLKTREFAMSIREGKYQNKDSGILSNKSQISDLLSTFYQMRTIQQKDVSTIDTLYFSYLYQGHVYKSFIINHGEEIIKTKFGDIKAIKLEPFLEKGRIFKSSFGTFIWVSADDMHIPIKIEMPVLIGCVYVNLVKFENTFFEFNK